MFKTVKRYEKPNCRPSVIPVFALLGFGLLTILSLVAATLVVWTIIVVGQQQFCVPE